LATQAGQILIVPPQPPHTSTISSDGSLRQIDIPRHSQGSAEWLEDRDRISRRSPDGKLHL
jgi:hypothetical protein